MGNIEPTITELEPHTEAKHWLLKTYLGAWFNIVAQASYFENLFYIDGFSASGLYSKGEFGSPLIALQIANETAIKNPNKNYYLGFIEAREDRIKVLESEIAKMGPRPNVRPKIFHGEFKSHINDILKKIKSTPKTATFAFIDPYGFTEFDFSHITELLRIPHSEVFINLMTYSIRRSVPIKNVNIDPVFGIENAAEKLLQLPGDLDDKIRSLYTKQLSKLAQYVKFFQINLKTNQLLYDLFFATNNLTGYERMKSAFWKMDPMYGFSYSEIYKDHHIVFEGDKTIEVSELIKESFSGKKVLCETVLTEFKPSPYEPKHVRAALKYMESNEWLTVDPMQKNGRPRRSNQFPEMAKLTFN